ncbi:MAG: H-NS histone family protein [Pseudomonadota bacterium]|nr:H-NS histone family protein [Pseudomonadota bacterium]
MSNISALQQKLNEAEAVANDLRKQLETERKGERTQAITAVKELIKTHELSAADLGFSGKGAAKRTVGDKRNVVAPKYQDPDSGKTWTGRGKSPSWLSAQLAAGRNKQDFLIQS